MNLNPNTHYAVASLAIGRDYLRSAVACMISCRRHSVCPCDYVVFYANADPGVFEIPEWLQLVCIDELVYSRFSRYELMTNKCLAREFKHVPLSHALLREKCVLFLDADVYAFADALTPLFGLIDQHQIILFAKDKKDYPIYQNKRLGFNLNLVDEGKRLGLNLSNLSPNTGIMGRSVHPKALEFADTAKRLLEEKPLTPYPDPNYFNDEPLFSVAYQLVTLGQSFGFIDIDTSLYVHTHKNGVLRNTDTQHPDVEWVHNRSYFPKPALVHFIGFREFPYYLNRVESEVPFVEDGNRHI